jgi:hypothetical protein
MTKRNGSHDYKVESGIRTGIMGARRKQGDKKNDEDDNINHGTDENSNTTKSSLSNLQHSGIQRRRIRRRRQQQVSTIGNCTNERMVSYLRTQQEQQRSEEQEQELDQSSIAELRTKPASAKATATQSTTLVRTRNTNISYRVSVIKSFMIVCLLIGGSSVSIFTYRMLLKQQKEEMCQLVRTYCCHE